MHIKSSQMELKRHEFFEDIIAHSKELFTGLGMSEEVAEQAGISFVDFICNNWAGQHLTIPMDYHYKVASRELEMYKFHRGSFSETAKKFNVSERHCRRVLNKVYKMIHSKLQGDLFNNDENK